MLRQIKEGLDYLDNKQLIDTIFSLGRLHKRQDKASLEKYGDAKFFNYLFQDFLDQLIGDENASRVEEMRALELSYLVKGLENLSKFFEKENKLREKELKNKIIARCQEIFDN